MSEKRTLPAGYTPVGDFALAHAWDGLFKLVNALTAPGNQLPAGTAKLDALEAAELLRDALTRLEQDTGDANALESNPAIAALIAQASDDAPAGDGEGVDRGK